MHAVIKDTFLQRWRRCCSAPFPKRLPEAATRPGVSPSAAHLWSQAPRPSRGSSSSAARAAVPSGPAVRPSPPRPPLWWWQRVGGESRRPVETPHTHTPEALLTPSLHCTALCVYVNPKLRPAPPLTGSVGSAVCLNPD